MPAWDLGTSSAVTHRRGACPPVRSAPAITATPVSSTSGEVTVYPAPSTSAPYVLTIAPVGGGSSIAVTCAAPACQVGGLSPATTYGASVVATDASGYPTPSSLTVALTTPGAGAPTLVSFATGSTSLTVRIGPPPGVTGPYAVTATPQNGGPALVNICATPDCSVSGLAPGTAYAVTATGTDAGGMPTPPSAPESVMTATPVTGWVPPPPHTLLSGARASAPRVLPPERHCSPCLQSTRA